MVLLSFVLITWGGICFYHTVIQPYLQTNPSSGTGNIFLRSDYDGLGDRTSRDQTGGVVILDAGHGGDDVGCMVDEYQEKEITLAIAKLVQQKLEEKGVVTVLTRSGDDTVSLAQRTQIAAQAGSSLFVSIHSNSYVQDSTVSGLECYYYQNAQGRQLGELIKKAVEDAGIKTRKVKSEDFYVLRENSMPAVLVETGFMTNPEELNRLLDPSYQDQLAGAVADGILNMLNNGV